jgi:hypothetical protein
VSEGLRWEGCWSDFILYHPWDALLTMGKEHCQFQSPIKCILTCIVDHRAEHLVPHTEVAETEQDVVPEPSCCRATA